VDKPCDKGNQICDAFMLQVTASTAPVQITAGAGTILVPPTAANPTVASLATAQPDVQRGVKRVAPQQLTRTQL